MNTELAELLVTTATIDDDGWAAVAAVAHDVDVDLLADVVAGRRPATVLPEQLATAVADRFDTSALHDDTGQAEAPELGRGLLDDEALLLRLLAEELAETRTTTRSDTLRLVAAAVTTIGAPPCVVPWIQSRVIAGITRFDGMAAPLSGRHRIEAASWLVHAAAAHGVLDEFAVDIDPAARPLFAAAAALDRSPMPSAWAGDVAVALRWASAEVEAPVSTPWGALDDHQLRLRLAITFLSQHPQLLGPGGLAELWQHPEGGAGEVADLVAAAVGTRLAHPKLASTLDAQVAELLGDHTSQGTTAAPLPHLTLTTLPALPPAVVLCAAPEPVGRATRDRALFERIAQCSAGEFGQAWSDADLDAALELREGFRAGVGVAALTASVPIDRVLPCVRAAAAREAGLVAVLSRSSVARDELCAAAHGVGPAVWETILALLDGFAGTPAELVKVAVEAAPPG
jgi:hypothetical protein